MNFASLLPWKWTKLDPTRTQAARQHFDTEGKYDLWQSYCQSQFRRKISSSPGELATKGVEVVRLLSSAGAAEAKDLLLQKSKEFAVSKKNIDYADVMKFSNTDFLTPILEKMFNKEVDERIASIFGSEYFVQALAANRTMPAKASKRSFLWHCDRGPKNFLKINMFLDATSEHGGTTEFLDLEASKRVEDIGYTFGANPRRVADIRPIARKFGIDANVIHPQLDAGEAFMFFPARSLHRGFLPTRGIRHMLLLVILPSPIHWKEAWKETSKTGYHMNNSGVFPDNAEDLYAELGLTKMPLDRAA
jgi:hypothetical protein